MCALTLPLSQIQPSSHWSMLHSGRCQKPVLIDGNYEYYNLFDAMVDAFVAAMARAVGKEDVKIVVSETGWPTKGNEP